jgi:hypothetical protein
MESWVNVKVGMCLPLASFNNIWIQLKWEALGAFALISKVVGGQRCIITFIPGLKHLRTTSIKCLNIGVLCTNVHRFETFHSNK